MQGEPINERGYIRSPSDLGSEWVRSSPVAESLAGLRAAPFRDRTDPPPFSAFARMGKVNRGPSAAAISSPGKEKKKKKDKPCLGELLTTVFVIFVMMHIQLTDMVLHDGIAITRPFESASGMLTTLTTCPENLHSISSA